jgi:acylphosphatase
VQGVWFRESCRRTADHHGVAGWIRNLPDGRVEAVFEGGQEPVGYLVDWCREGSRRAVVTRVDVRAEMPEGLAHFEVR